MVTDWANLKKVILVCAYRSWSIEIFDNLYKNERFIDQFDFLLAKNQHSLHSILDSAEKIDVIICVGWSWLIPDEITKKYFVCGLHPSNLPEFAGGSPIQNQILNGVNESKFTLFKFTDQIDSGPIIKKADLSLDGHIYDIFQRLVQVGSNLLIDFLIEYPSYDLLSTAPPSKIWKRIRPDQSKLNANDFENLSVREIYDFIRCREDPYPNAFIEDETGRLEFKLVNYLPNMNQ